jgi:hypothetical protein
MDIIPYESRIIIPLRESDEQFIEIQNLIDAKRKFLIDKQKKLRFIARQNRFLEAVKNDYKKYNDYLTQQKRDQIRALEALDEYIKDLTISGKLTKHNIEDAKVEQAKILREVKSIKENLDSIINNVDDVQISLNKKKYNSL